MSKTWQELLQLLQSNVNDEGFEAMLDNDPERKAWFIEGLATACHYTTSLEELERRKRRLKKALKKGLKAIGFMDVLRPPHGHDPLDLNFYPDCPGCQAEVQCKHSPNCGNRSCSGCS